MDGTLTKPQNYMFREMRDVLNITAGIDILDHVEGLPPAEQAEAHEALEEIEKRAMAKMQPQEGISELMQFLENRGVRTAICTRNFDLPVAHLLKTYLADFKMDPIVTRSFKPPKPAPHGILSIAQEWEVSPSELVMVGDSQDDILAAHNAGVMAVLLRNSSNVHLADMPECCAVIDSLPEFISLAKLE